MIAGAVDRSRDVASDRLIVVGRRAVVRPVFDELRTRFPHWRVLACDSYLSGIAEVSRSPARVVMAWVDESVHRLEAAVSALREAAGPNARLLLCCTTSTEAAARRVLPAGADEYVLFPFDGPELDAAIGVDRAVGGVDARLSAVPAASMEELKRLAEALSAMGGDPRILLERIAAVVRVAMSARGATVVASGSVATAGEPVLRPVLSTALKQGAGAVGRIAVTDRMEGAYSTGDANKLEHYATLAGHLLEAANRQREWHQLAHTDMCSGLPNRRFLHDQLDVILARAASEKFEVTVLLFDVDDFKSYNDTYGHEAGDEVLRVIGRLFRRDCREQDVVTRYGGDEFAVVFWDAEGPRVAGSKHPQAALSVLERFTEALRAHRLSCIKPGDVARLTISGGLATFPWDGSDRAAILRRADEALRAAKRAGKNRIVVIGA